MAILLLYAVFPAAFQAFAQTEDQMTAVDTDDEPAEVQLPVIQTIPDTLRTPRRGEAPRLPRDMVIGDLGQGSAPEEVYLFANDVLSALLRNARTAPAVGGSLRVLSQKLFEEIAAFQPRAYRIGGGRIEADGSVSFIVRFISREESLSGELFVRQRDEDSPWFVDDLIFENARSLSEIKDSYRFDFSPYERFF